jgi:hypothetical protein
MVQEFTLINPQIVGNYNTTFSGKNAESAAEAAWLSLSKHITNNVPQFAMTLKGGGSQLHHFLVKESADGTSKLADYTIQSVESSMSAQQEKNLIAHSSKMAKLSHDDEQSGGRKHRKHHDDDDDDSSSSSSSDSDDLYEKVKLFKYRRLNQPFVYWWYNPLIYKVDSFYIPTFSLPLTPYVEINVNSSFLG